MMGGGRGRMEDGGCGWGWVSGVTVTFIQILLVMDG